MDAEVTKRFSFDAAHQLPNHDGKCARPHGHTYTVEVTCRGQVEDRTDHPKEGMALDFSEIKVVWQEQLEQLLDHQDLNETIGPVIGTTTAENIAAYIFRVYQAAPLPVVKVRVAETPDSWVAIGWMLTLA